jgi:hypothetical protein
MPQANKGEQSERMGDGAFLMVYGSVWRTRLR